MKKISFLLVTLVILFTWFVREKKAELLTASPPNATQPLKILPTIKYPPKPQVAVVRRPSSQAQPQTESTPDFDINIHEEPLKIGRSFHLVKGILAINKANFSESLGEKLMERSGFIYFRPSQNDTLASPVAQDESSKRLFPVSHVLHVKGVGPELRDQFKSEGLKEFYYHKRLKFISLESTPAKVLKQFQELTARGYDASLEVLKDPHKTK